MAQIITYPKLSTLANNDLLIVSDVSSTNKTTNSLEVDTLAQHIIVTNNVITGGGTVNQLAMFTPTGVKIGDSIVSQAALGQGITVDGQLDVTDDANIQNSLQTNTLEVVSSSDFGGDATFSSTITAGGGTGTAGQVLSSTGTGVQWIDNTNTTYDLTGAVSGGGDYKVVLTGSDGTVDDVTFEAGTGIILADQGTNTVQIQATNSGTVTGTGTTNTLPVWSDGPNGILTNSSISQVLDGGNNVKEINIATFSGQSSDFKINGAASKVSFGTTGNDIFLLSGDNTGFYTKNFQMRGTLAVGRPQQSTAVTLDVGASTDTRPAAWFRNGVVISNNPAGVQVDNTSMVIGAGNNDIVSGSDNCLAVGNNNQILADSDHSLAVGQGNTMTNADNSIVVGQQNDLTGNRLYVLGFSNELTCASSFAMGGDNVVEGTQNQFAIGYNHVLGTAGGTEQKQIAIGTANNLSGTNIDQGIAVGNNLRADVFSNYQTGILLLGKGNTNTRYDVGTFGINPAVIISGGTGVNSDAIIVTNSGGNISQVVLPEVFSNNNYVDDAAAAAGGVPIGGIYHNAGALRIRLV